MQLDEILEILRSGCESELEDLSQKFPGFPKGRDPIVGELWFIIAMDTASPATIRWMIKNGVDINLKSDANEAPIQACIDRKGIDRYEILQDLIIGGADIELRGANDWTPLHWAAARNDFRAVEQLLKAGADITARTHMDLHATPEEEALALGCTEAAEVLKNWRLRHGSSA